MSNQGSRYKSAEIYAMGRAELEQAVISLDDYNGELATENAELKRRLAHYVDGDEDYLFKDNAILTGELNETKRRLGALEWAAHLIVDRYLLGRDVDDSYFAILEAALRPAEETVDVG